MKKQKAANRDFTEENLPHNRVEVFFDVLKQRYDVLLKIGAILLAFLLPTLIVGIISDLTYLAVISKGQATEEELAALNQTFALINVGPIAFFGLGLAGAMKVVRNLVWGEPVFFGKDFFSGIKQNRLIYVFVFLVYALVNLLLSYLNAFISDEFLRAIPSAVCLMVLAPIGMFVLSATAVYKDGFLSILKNSVKFFVKTAPVCFVFILVLASAFLIDYIELFVLRCVLKVLIIVLFLPLYLVSWTLYSHKIFDKMVNSTLYPEYVDKNIYRL